ncbi:response regulator [Sedimenticola selenatireducens]|nr:response regulator [Sedimenticola selenatireducens]
MKNEGTQRYSIIAGVLCLDLFMVLGKLPPWMLVPAIVVSIVIIYRVITVQINGGNPTHVSEQKKSTDSEDNVKKYKTASPAEILQDRQETSIPDKLGNIRLLLLSGSNKAKREISDHLNGWGVNFVEAGSSARAFAMLIESADTGKPFQTVLVDQSSLDMEECQFATALRAEPSLQSLYLIYYGGSTLPPRTEQLYMAGYSGMLSAPLDKTLLFKALHNARETAIHHHNVVQLLDHYETEKVQQPLDILIAGGSHNECRKIHRILGNAGHQAFIVSDSTEILEALDNHHFDLAILDADMPEISGIEAIKLYRFAHLNQPWIPFILLLDSPNSQTIQACEAADIEHLIVKPISTQRLLETVARATDLTSQGHNDEIFDYPTISGSTHYHDNSLTLDTHQLNELKRLGKEKDFLLQLVNQFDKETVALIKGLQLAATNHDIKSIQDYGHKLKDTAGNLGALNLYRMAVRLTKIKDMEFGFELDTLVNEIENCRIATIEALHDHLFHGNNSAYRKE